MPADALATVLTVEASATVSEFGDEIRRIREEKHAQRNAEARRDGDAERQMRRLANGLARAVLLRTRVIEPLAREVAEALSWKIDFHLDPRGQGEGATSCAFTAPDGARRVVAVRLDWKDTPHFKVAASGPLEPPPAPISLHLDSFDEEQLINWWKDILRRFARQWA